MRPAPTTSLFDQSALSEIADRLVTAARKAGADAADAVVVRSVSLSVEVRDGAVEESERAEGDDLGLRVLVGKKQAIASTNDLSPAAMVELVTRGDLQRCMVVCPGSLAERRPVRPSVAYPRRKLR